MKPVIKRCEQLYFNTLCSDCYHGRPTDVAAFNLSTYQAGS